MSKVSSTILSAVGYKIGIEPYSQQQLELIVHQRLKFCGISYGDDEEVPKTVIKYGNGNLNLILDFLKICILMVQSENHKKLNLKLIERVSKLF